MTILTDGRAEGNILMVNCSKTIRELVDVATYHKVSLAGGIGIWLQFLSEDAGAHTLALCVGNTLNLFLGDSQDAARAACTIIDSVSVVGNLVLDRLNSQLSEQTHIVTRCKVFTGFGHVVFGSPDKSGGKFFNSIENLHLCTMNNQGLLALAQLILPSEILSNFEVVRVEEEASLIRIYLDESVKAEYKENPEIESKGFCEAVTIRDFPIRDKGVDLIVRRRKWYDKQNNRYFSDSYDLKAEETRYSKEFAAFLKGVYGDDSYDLPFA